MNTEKTRPCFEELELCEFKIIDIKEYENGGSIVYEKCKKCGQENEQWTLSNNDTTYNN